MKEDITNTEKMINLFEKETELNYYKISGSVESPPDEYIVWLEDRLANFFIMHGDEKAGQIIKKSCKHCAYYCRSSCRRYSPKFISGNISDFPEVDKNSDWCGEFKPKEAK